MKKITFVRSSQNIITFLLVFALVFSCHFVKAQANKYRFEAMQETHTSIAGGSLVSFGSGIPNTGNWVDAGVVVTCLEVILSVGKSATFSP